MLGLARSTVVEVFGGCLEKFNLDPGACLVRRQGEPVKGFSQRTEEIRRENGFAAAAAAAAGGGASSAGGTWLGMLVLYLLGALRHVWPLS
ncbi:hypothetical protein Peur_008561 [Populus x canadensis]